MAKKTNNPQRNQATTTTIPTENLSNNFPWLWVLGLLLLTAIIYSPIFQNTFTNWDDEQYVTKSPMMQAVAKGDWSSIFTDPVASNYHPLTMLSLAINYKIGGLNPFGYQLINVAFHLLNTFLVFVFFWNFTDKKTTSTLIIAALFALHPMHVESVAWISERKDVLYTFFFLLGMINYWKYLTLDVKNYFYYALIFFVLSLLSKPAAIIFPLVMLLLDYYKGRPFGKNMLLEKIPFFLLSFAFAVLTLQIQSKTAIADVNKFSLIERFFFACYGLSDYAIKAILPFGLSALHPFPKGLSTVHYASILGVLTLGGLLFLQKNNKNIVFGILFYLINLLLVLQVVAIGNAVVAERYTYVSYLGLFFIIAYFIDNQNNTIATIFKYGSIAAIAIFSFLTFNQIKTWKNSETLWTKAIESYPTSSVALSNRALVYYNAGQHQKAIDDVNISLQNEPEHLKSLQFRALALIGLKQYDVAFKDAANFVSLAPENADAYMARGTAYSGLLQDDLALADYDKTAQLSPNMTEVYNNRGTLLFNRKKDYQRALSDFDKALSLDPKRVTAMLNRSYCHFFLGDKIKALADANAAIALGAKPTAAYMEGLK